MTLAPLLAAGPTVIAHAVAAFAALGIGVVQFTLAKGTSRHRALGWLWIAVMAGVALSSFGIHGLRQVGPFSWIHLISLFNLVMLAVAIAHARAGRIAAHRWTMVGLFLGALVITGLFTLVPGRIMHRVLFG